MKKIFILICVFIILSGVQEASSDSYFTSDKHNWSLVNGNLWVTLDSVAKTTCIRFLITGMDVGSAAVCQQIEADNSELAGLEEIRVKILRSLLPDCGVDKIVSYIDKAYEDKSNRIIPVLDITYIMAKEQKGEFNESGRPKILSNLASKYIKIQKP